MPFDVASFGPPRKVRLYGSRWLKWRTWRLWRPATLLNLPAIFYIVAALLRFRHLTPLNLWIAALLTGCGIWALLDPCLPEPIENEDPFGWLAIEHGQRSFTPVRLELRRRIFEEVGDMGIVWFSEGRLHYRGLRTSFDLTTRFVERKEESTVLPRRWKNFRVWVQDRWIGVRFSAFWIVDLPAEFLKDFAAWELASPPGGAEVLPPAMFDSAECAPSRRELPLRPITAMLSGVGVFGIVALLKGRAEGVLFILLPFIMPAIIHLLRPTIRTLTRKLTRVTDEVEEPASLSQFKEHLRANPHLLDKYEFADPPPAASVD